MVNMLTSSTVNVGSSTARVQTKDL